MEKYFEVLRTCRLFEGIAEGQLEKMLSCFGAAKRTFLKNQMILTEGDDIGAIGVLLSGVAQIIRVDYYGNRSIVTELRPGQIFGEAFACAGIKKSPVNVVAAEDCGILFVDIPRMLHLCGNACEFHHQMIYNLMKVVATKNIVLNQKLEIISKRTTREKLMTYLMQQAKQTGSNSFTIPFDRQELADYLEVDRSGLSAEIGKLRGEGILECRKSTFTLLLQDSHG